MKSAKISTCTAELEDLHHKVINGVICHFLTNVTFLYKSALYVISLTLQVLQKRREGKSVRYLNLRHSIDQTFLQLNFALVSQISFLVDNSLIN